MNNTGGGEERNKQISTSNDDIIIVREEPLWDNIPEELELLPHWVCWKWEPKKDKKGNVCYDKNTGKVIYSKPPYNPKNGYPASPTDPQNWGTFEQAKQRFLEDNTMYGVGFVFTKELEIVGCDLDKCLIINQSNNEPRIDLWALEIINLLNSYTEITPSGRGLRILVKAYKPGQKAKQGPFEMYEVSRYLTITGRILKGFPNTTEPRQKEIEKVYYLMFSETANQKPPVPIENFSKTVAPIFSLHSAPTWNITDSQLLEKAYQATNGIKFQKLWEGQWEGYYASQSEGDLALCVNLAFWTHGDTAQIDRLFRLSRLYRKKWDESHFANGKTYGQITIEKALNKCPAFYDPNIICTYCQKEIQFHQEKPINPDGTQHRCKEYKETQKMQSQNDTSTPSTSTERGEEEEKHRRGGIEEQAKAQAPQPYHIWLREKQQRDSQREPGDLLGYNLQTFHTLAQNIDGIQPGFYIIGAEANIGKTAFLTNLTLDILKTNPQIKALYFSLDDSTEVITNRFLAILSNLPINKLQRRLEGNEKEALNEAYNTVYDYAEKRRLIIKDLSEIYAIGSLENEIRLRATKDLFIAIDGIYNLDIGGSKGGIREENIERANHLKAIVDTYHLPLVCTAEVRKRSLGQTSRDLSIHDIMESGKFSYNANLILLLGEEEEAGINKRTANFDNDNESITLIVNYAKNKLSWFKGKQKLQFFRRQGRMLEVIEEEHNEWIRK